MTEELSGKLNINTTDFKANINEANRHIRLLQAEFRASAAGLQDWTKDATGLEARAKSLTGQIEQQKIKIANLEAEYQKMADAGNTSQKQLDEERINILKANEALGKMQVELDKTTKSTKDLGDKQEDAGKKTLTFGQVMGGLGAVVTTTAATIATAALAVAGLGAGIAKLVLDASGAADELQEVSDKTGISTTRLQELAYVSNQVGVSTETITGGLAKLTRTMDQARKQSQDYAAKLADARAKEAELSAELAKTPTWSDKYKKLTEQLEEARAATADLQTGDAAAAFQALGISVTDASGKLRDSQTVFNEAIDALSKLPDGADRDALAMSIFGKSAMELNLLIKAGSEEIAKLSKEAHDMGAVVKEEDVEGLADFSDQLASLKAGLKGTAETAAAAFLPAFSGLADQAKGYLKDFAAIVSGSNGDLTKMATGIGELLGRIIGDVAKQAPAMLQAGMEIIKGIVGAILKALPGLIPAVVGMLTSLVQFVIQALPILMQAGLQLVLALVNGILPQLPALVTAAVQMIVTLVNGIADALPQLMELIATVIPQVIIVLLDNLPLLIEAALKLITALVQGLVIALPILIEYTPEIITAVYDALIASLPMILTAAVELIQTLVKGIADSMPQIIQSGVDIMYAYRDGATGVLYMIAELGGTIVSGVWQGIQDNAAWFTKNVTDFFTGIVNSVKGVLGIQSPSKVFAGIGANMAAGLGQGFGAAMRDVERQIAGAMGGMTLSLAGAGGSSIQMGNIYVSVPPGTANPTAFGRSVGNEVNRTVTRKLRSIGAK